MKISSARIAAFDVLFEIEEERAFSSGLLPAYEERLSSVDRGLCHEIVLGVLRRRMLLDRWIDELVGSRKLDIEVRIALRIGLFQILFLERVPDHAAVNDSVALVGRAHKSSARGLVNAVLRKAAKGLPDLEFIDDVERISVETSHPRWLIEKWIDEFGKVEAESLAHANNSQPPLAFRPTVKGMQLSQELKYAPSEYVENCYLAETIDDKLKKLSEDGLIYFQDEGSQMVAASVEPPAGGSILDVCASPGGKITAIAALANASGATFYAGDVSRRRIELLHETCRRQGAAFINIVQYDARVDLPFCERQFDFVFVDAPCSGTGTIRHNPEIRYFLSPDDPSRLQKTQLAIIRNASKTVKPDGYLIYSTCSLEREENESVCEQFLADSADFEKVRPQVPYKFVGDNSFARTYPHRDQMDGFFIASFRQVSV